MEAKHVQGAKVGKDAEVKAFNDRWFLVDAQTTTLESYSCYLAVRA